MSRFRQNELRVQWETDANPPGTIALAADRFLHRAVATRLGADTAYVSRVRSGATTSASYPSAAPGVRVFPTVAGER